MARGSKAAIDDDRDIAYPTRDGRPMGETDLHRNKMQDLIATLEDHFARDPNVYVSGNLLVFYERGDKRKHVSPDVFVVRGVSKSPMRDHYLIWREGKAPEFVIEVTSKTTRREDQTKKPILYRDLIKVSEYFLFDPTEDYLIPPFQGFQLVEGEYVPIEPVEGRLPSVVLGLHLERSGVDLRLYDPRTRSWLRTPRERAESEHERAESEHERAEVERERAESAHERAESAHERAETESRRADREMAERMQVEVELSRLRDENESLRRRLSQ
jgi:Uma2 family endonuclease